MRYAEDLRNTMADVYSRFFTADRHEEKND
jgi:hypothetical protein